MEGRLFLMNNTASLALRRPFLNLVKWSFPARPVSPLRRVLPPVRLAHIFLHALVHLVATPFRRFAARRQKKKKKKPGRGQRREAEWGGQWRRPKLVQKPKNNE
eukprot:TRINITY_DN4592_c0_g1_i1.p1 TRINITY_DN4592_c0_g1~~TRINITY_DN4592_c0_g1_i1.p1  ORF type:complete len:104 (+),score=5.18 TRINITY_DN4592_c0_g1_i1:79-390(+)